VSYVHEALGSVRHGNTVFHLPIRHDLMEERVSAAQKINRMPNHEEE
jgi:hypothetical protein